MTVLRPFAILLAAGTAMAATPALAGDWVVDAAHSKIGFSGVQVGVPFQGQFGQYDAKISFDPAHPEAAHVAISIDMASAKTGDTQRDEAMPQSEWFDVGKFPHAMFEATGFQAKGADSYTTAGTLTIRGIAQPVTLPFTLHIDGTTAQAKAHADLVRTNFGVGQGNWASGQWVALQVGVDIDLTAHQADAR